MLKDSTSHQELIKRLKMQSKQIEDMSKKILMLQEALIRNNKMTVCELDDSLALITPITTKIFCNVNNTVIAFGGMKQQLGMPPEEFLKTFTNKKVNAIFIKDFKQCWYQQGLLGLSSSIKDTAEIIKKIIPAQQKNIYTVGTSSGGFAAILFGVLINATRIIAFGPQTIITKEAFEQFKSLDSRLTDINFGDEILDIKQLLETTRYSGQIHIHFARNNSVDKTAVERLSHIDSVSLYGWETDNHNIASWLKHEKKLDSIFADLF